MQIDRAALEERFRDMSEAEILEGLRAGDLTTLAVEVALAEATQRGFGLAARAALEDSQTVEVPHGHGPLRILTRYLLPIDAQILAARLQAEGVAAQVMDSDTIYASGALWGSLARGGVRVMVPESQIADAERIRVAFDAGEYAIDEDYDVDK
jgi:hypothetical protein